MLLDLLATWDFGADSTARLGSHPYSHCIPALATMHGKEKAIAPAFKRHLGMSVLPCDFIDTDAFGTFTGEIVRQATPLETAIAKAKLGSRREQLNKKVTL